MGKLHDTPVIPNPIVQNDAAGKEASEQWNFLGVVQLCVVQRLTAVAVVPPCVSMLSHPRDVLHRRVALRRRCARA